MSANTIDANLLAKMFLAGAKNLESKKEYINELNVFPVPDGDTGTNMTLTIMSAANEIANLENPDMATLCKAISSGSLRGARGNSGVILSQLLRGFTKVVKEQDELDIAIISAGCDKAVETAYKAVMKPKEGTILTVAKGVAEKAAELFENGEEDFKNFAEICISYGFEVLAKTPDMLPVLKEAGVVDSGGQGLMEFLQGAFDAFCGKEVSFEVNNVAEEGNGLSLTCEPEIKESKYEYAVSYKVILAKSFNVKTEADFKSYLENIGEINSVLVDEQNGTVEVAMITNDPGLVIQKGIKYGSLVNVIVSNEKVSGNSDEQNIEQNNKENNLDSNNATKPTDNVCAAKEPKKPFGFVSVSVGDGIGEIFRNLGVDELIEGGQTMNPSTEDMMKAIEAINAETVYILPNNKNIIMAANQARDITEDKNVIVIPTKTVPQGIAALIGFVPDASAEDNEAGMIEAAENVKTGQVTYAVRDTVIEGAEIHVDDYMGIGDQGLLSNGKDIKVVIDEMVSKLVSDDTELISIYYGSDVTEDDASEIETMITEKYPDIDIEFQNGGQPVYYYIISAE